MTDQNVSERVSDELRDGGYSLRTPQFSIEAAYEKARSTIASLQAELESVKARNVALERVVETAKKYRSAKHSFVNAGGAPAYSQLTYAEIELIRAADSLAALEDTTDGEH